MDLTKFASRVAPFLPTSRMHCDGPLREKEKSVKVSHLKLWVGDKGLDVFKGFIFAKPEDAAKLKVVLKKFEEYGAPRKKPHNGCLDI